MKEEIMFKKVFMIVILCVGLGGIGGLQEAKAWFRPAGGFGARLSSFVCEADWKGAGNTTKEDYGSWITCNLSWINVQGSCENYGGGTGGEGTVFTKEIPGSESSTIQLEAQDFDGKGQTSSENEIQTCNFYYELEQQGDVCINPNWSIIPPPDCDAPNYPGVNTAPLYVTGTWMCIEAWDADTDFSYIEGYCTLYTEDDTGPLGPDYYYYVCDEKGRGKGACPPPPTEDPAPAE
jgi:hypothetical protein